MASKQVATQDKAGTAVSTVVAQANHSLMVRVASRFGVEPEKMNSALKATAFRQRGKDGAPGPEISNEQMLMLMVIADQYKLNPFTREIYAFPSENGIVAIVSVDGWIRIINERPELSSITFDVAPPGTEDPWISCTIERKDRTQPVTITEYLSECTRDTKPWNSHPRRMLRHKALIQCARVAFGFGGIFDPDEGERIVSIVEQPTIVGKPHTAEPRKLEQPPEVERVSSVQAADLANRLKAEGVAVNLLLAKYEIGTIEEMPETQYIAAVQWIERASANG